MPRTATVKAAEDTVLRSLGRGEFLDAVTGSDQSQVIADDIVSRRLVV